MKRLTFRIFVIALLVLLSSVVCIRGNIKLPTKIIPTIQEQIKPKLQTNNQEQNNKETQAVIQEQTQPESQSTQVQNEYPEANSNSGPMKRVTISQAKSRNAVCNDGTPAVYYIRRGVGTGTTRWIIHLQGGGFCFSPESCNQRKKQEPQFMTSNGVLRSRPGEGILSPSSGDNKYFASANHVYLAYCSSDLWSGDRAASSETNGLNFRGATIFRSIIDDLADSSITASPNLTDATQVILSGSSAGGVGVMVHLDWLAAKFSNAKVVGINDAGWFIDFAPYKPDITPVDERAQLAYAYWNGRVDESCSTAKPDQEGLCYLGEYVYPYISTPLFVQIAQFDGQQLVSLGIQLPIDDEELKYAMKFGEAVRASLESVDAAFSPAKRTHGLLIGDKFQSVLIQNKSMMDILGNWFFNLDGPTKVIDQP